MVVLTCAVSALTSPVQSVAVQTAQLNPRIGPAVPQRYQAILHGRDWQNPYLVVGRDDIDLIVKRLASGRRTVAVADLEQTLVDLPVTVWPYGRVAAVQTVGIVAGDRSDDKSIADNLARTLAILKTLNVTVERWPA